MNKLIYALSAAGLAAFTFAGLVTAQEAQHTTDAALDFMAVDTDLSGDITLKELVAVDPDFSVELYAQADFDGNGLLDQAEYGTLVETGVLVAPMEG